MRERRLQVVVALGRCSASLVVLVLTEANEHDVARGHPHLLSHLSSDVTCVEIKILRRVRQHPTHWLISTQDLTKPRHAVEAVALAAPVAQHADDLGVLLARLLEFELAFGLLVLVLAAPPVLAALALILRHDLRVAASSGPARGTRIAKVACASSRRRRRR